jgi:hypothetical protein
MFKKEKEEIVAKPTELLTTVIEFAKQLESESKAQIRLKDGKFESTEFRISNSGRFMPQFLWVYDRKALDDLAELVKWAQDTANNNK